MCFRYERISTLPTLDMQTCDPLRSEILSRAAGQESGRDLASAPAQCDRAGISS
jgi:hypothetical protein